MFYTTIDTHEGYKLVRRPDTPNLYIYWYPQEGGRVRRRSTGTSDRDEAGRRLRAFVEARQPPVGPSSGDACLLDLLSEYVDRALEGKPSQDVARNALLHFTQFCETDDLVYLSELDLDRQERYIAWRRERIRSRGNAGSNGTIRRELGVLKAALNFAHKRGQLSAVPHVTGLPEPPPRQRYLTREEFHRLLAACEPTLHLWRFVMISVHTMQRPSAVLELHERQIDWERKRIDFRDPSAPATKKARPVVPMTPTVDTVLREAIAESATGHAIEWRGLPLKCIRLSFTRACRRANLDGVCVYTLRHTGATLAAAAGVPMRQLAGMLGHSEITTTERYAKHSPEFLGDAAAALDELFAEPKRLTDRSHPRAAGTLAVPDDPTAATRC
ncbi:MAG: tyrosine-type recombinase/integrase [Planctomycetota bacterium]